MSKVVMMPFDEAKAVFDERARVLNFGGVGFNHYNGPEDIHGISRYHWSKARKKYPDLSQAPKFTRRTSVIFDTYMIQFESGFMFVPCCCCVIEEDPEPKSHAKWLLDRFLRRD